MSLTQKEQQILTSIVIASENDPKKPEFPAEDPKFPATPTYKIDILGFENIFIKDESFNPTGTHKDRMAWEMIVTYRDFLIAKKEGRLKKLPSLSIISSVSAAFAIQTQLKKYSLPNLKVLIDFNLDNTLKIVLKDISCELYECDLSKKMLDWRDILKMTNNEDGIDITSSQALDPTTRYYDWLSYEIINSSPDYCFIPFGTGNLYENILNITKREISTQNHDPRFSGNIEKLKTCNFIGATTNDARSKATKLYSPHLPFVHFDEQWIRTYKYSGFCGENSNIYVLQESFLDDAIKLAQTLKIRCEPSGIAGLAMFLQMKDSIPNDAKVLIVNTGKSKYI